jgi:hypothetical protein
MDDDVRPVILKALGSGNTTSAISSLLGLTQGSNQTYHRGSRAQSVGGTDGFGVTPQGAEQLAPQFRAGHGRGG